MYSYLWWSTSYAIEFSSADWKESSESMSSIWLTTCHLSCTPFANAWAQKILQTIPNVFLGSNGAMAN